MAPNLPSTVDISQETVSKNFKCLEKDKPIKKAENAAFSEDILICMPILPPSNHDNLRANTFQENVLTNLDLKCLEKLEESPKKAKTQKNKARPLVVCPDCKLEVLSNSIKLHRQRHLKKLSATKAHKCQFKGCSYSTGRKSTLSQHAKVHDTTHQLDKILRLKQKKQLRRNEQATTSRTTALPQRGTEHASTQTDLFVEHRRTQCDMLANAEQEDRSTGVAEHASSQTDLFVEHRFTQSEQLRIASAKFKTLKDLLQIHYDLLAETAETNSSQLDTFAKIFEKMVNPVKDMFSLIRTLFEDKNTDRDAVMELSLDFKQMVSEMTKKTNELNEGDIAEFVHGAKITYVADTNVYIKHFDVMDDLMEMAQRGLCHVALPQKVISELDGLKKDYHCAFAARRSLRLLNTFNKCVITEPFLDYINDELLYSKTNIPRHEQADNSILSYGIKLLKKEKHSVVMLTEDAAVLSKFGSNSMKQPVISKYVFLLLLTIEYN